MGWLSFVIGFGSSMIMMIGVGVWLSVLDFATKPLVSFDGFDHGWALSGALTAVVLISSALAAPQFETWIAQRLT